MQQCTAIKWNLSQLFIAINVNAQDGGGTIYSETYNAVPFEVKLFHFELIYLSLISQMHMTWHDGGQNSD